MNCWLNLRHPIAERTEAFKAGLRRLGYTVEIGCTLNPGDRDILVSWNRIREGANAARAFEAAGRPVLITENASWGNDFLGGSWLTLANGYHNTAGRFPIGGSERWDSLGVELAPWRTSGGETVVLPQRGIGHPLVKMPVHWPQQQAGRVRQHPGRGAGRSLADDLAHAGKVVTWGSGAAVKALLWGIPVESHMPRWIAEQDNTEAGRLAMFRALAWGQWRLDEIRTGEALAWLLP